MDQMRLVKKQAETALDENFDLIEDDNDDNELAEMQAGELRKALQKIEPDERAILLMKYQDDFSIKDIAETFNLSESAVKMRLMRTKEKLKRIYMENIVFWLIVVVKAIWEWKK